MASKHCNDVSSGALVSFECDECERTFTTKQGRTRHKTVTHKKENVKKEEMLKQAQSVADKQIFVISNANSVVTIVDRHGLLKLT